MSKASNKFFIYILDKHCFKIRDTLFFFEYILKRGETMLPNIPPKLFSLSAVVVGYILIDDATSNEQNAMGNWLILVAQVLSTNAFYRAVMQERGLEPVGSTETGKNNSKTFSGIHGQSAGNINTNREDKNEDKQTLVLLEKMVKAMQTEIDNIKNASKE